MRMDRTIKRTVTITITETWTIVWTSADEPPATVGQGPNSEECAQATQPATQNNAILGMVQSWSAATLQRGRPLGDDRRLFICAPPSVVRRPSSASVKQDDHDFEPCPILDSLPKEQCPENDPQVPQVLNQKPGRQRATPTRRRKQG
jgi:hypothetical protein